MYVHIQRYGHSVRELIPIDVCAHRRYIEKTHLVVGGITTRPLTHAVCVKAPARQEEQDSSIHAIQQEKQHQTKTTQHGCHLTMPSLHRPSSHCLHHLGSHSPPTKTNALPPVFSPPLLVRLHQLGGVGGAKFAVAVDKLETTKTTTNRQSMLIQQPGLDSCLMPRSQQLQYVSGQDC